MDSRHLMQLAVIVELGSVSRAAESLHLTQPTLSRTIKVIEDRVGSSVLRRGRYGVTPTPIGAMLAEEGQAIIERSRRAQRAVDNWKRGLSGELRIGIGPMLADTIMGDFAARPLSENWPYSVLINCEPVSRLIGDLQSDRLDVVIGSAHLSLAQERLVHFPLYSDRSGVFGRKSDPLTKRKTPVDPAELANCPWIECGTTSGLRDSTRVLLTAIGLPHIVPKLSLNGDINITARVVSQVGGLCFLSLKSAPYLCQRFDLAQVPIAAETPLNGVDMWTTAVKRDTPMITHFLNQLTRYLAQKGIPPHLA